MRANPPSDPGSGQSSTAAFEEFYRTHYADVLRFLARRTDSGQAEDLAHETFLIAWQKPAEIPAEPGEALAWLCGVARNCLRHQQRGAARYQALTLRAAETEPTVLVGPEDGVAHSLDLNRAWHVLRPEDQEVIALRAWDELTSPQAAAVLGISALAYRTRLRRARKALRTALESPQPNAPPVARRTPALAAQLPEPQPLEV